jgi:hypothetical protein
MDFLKFICDTTIVEFDIDEFYLKQLVNQAKRSSDQAKRLDKTHLTFACDRI